MKTKSSLIVVLTRLLLCVMLMGVWSQTARAELSDDPLPPTKAADCEEESDNWERVMCGVKNIVGFAQKISKVYSGFKGTFDAATFLARVFGILDHEVDLAAELKALHEHLDKLGAALDKRQVEVNQGNQLGLGLHMIEVAEQNIRLGMPFNQNTDSVNIAGAAVTTATLPLYFERYFTEFANDGDTAGAWKKVISDRPKPDNAGFVYDWRVGVPHLMQLIALRLAIIPVIDSKFAKDQVFREEFLRYWQTLREHYDNMMKGIRCGVTFKDHWYDYPSDFNYTDVSIACADIYTGIAAIKHLQYRGYPYWYRNLNCYYYDKNGTRQSCAAAADAFWQNVKNDELPPVTEALHNELLVKLPLFEMQSMMGLLSLYAYGESDLTERLQRIPVYEASNLCLDTDSGMLAAGTNVMIRECNGSSGQKWTYDRRTGTISNPVSGLCLDIAWESATRGMGVGLWFCTGHNSQKWAYDRTTHVVQNAIGTVLDIEWGRLEPGTQVWSWPQGGSKLWITALTSFWNGQPSASPGWRADQEPPRRGRTPALPQM